MAVMDQDTRHWYLQQMGIPVWLPKDVDSAVVPTALAPADVPEVTQQAELSVAKEAKAKVTEPVAKQRESSTEAVAAASATTEPTLWLVIPDVPSAQKAAAEDLLTKILGAVEVQPTNCQMIWGLPEVMPGSTVRWVWCFGVQAPAGLKAETLSLPSLADMLNNVDAKRQAWGLLKNSMPFA